MSRGEVRTRVCAVWQAGNLTSQDTEPPFERLIEIADIIREATLREVLSQMNMRDVGGEHPEWALSDKVYQALKSGKSPSGVEEKECRFMR